MEKSKERSFTLPESFTQIRISRLFTGAAICLLGLSQVAYAQETTVQGTTMEEVGPDSTSLFSDPIPLGEVVVSSLRIDREVRKVPASMVVVKPHDYQKQSALSLSSVLDKEPGITTGGDGIWATNINIRGFGENRLVSLIDGNRVETATDLTASLSMVDVNDVERVEIIKGAQSSLYGTGAMGGIVNIITKDGHFAERPYLSGNIISGIASANTLFSNHAAVETGSRRWYVRVSGTRSDADDIRTPEGDLPNSQYTMNNIAAKAGVKPFANHLLKIQYQRNWSTGVGIPGGDAFPGPAEATYTDISRDLLAASYEITNLTERLSSVRLNYFTQYIYRDVSMIPNTVSESTLPNGNIQRTTPELITPLGIHLTNGMQLQSTWNFTETNTLIAGIDIWGRNLRTERQKYILVEVLNPDREVLLTNHLERGETPIPASSFQSAGIFLQDEVHLLNDRLTLVAGGRLDEIMVKNEAGYDVDYLVVNGTRNDSPPTRRVTFEENSEQNLSWSASAGALYQVHRDINLSLNVARSFRSPSLEERYKYIDLGNFVRLGDPSLDPEKGISADLGVRMWNPGFSFQSAVFMNRITDMIVESPGEFVYTLASGSEPDTIPALVNSNVSKALLYGWDINFEYHAYKNLVLFGSGSFVRGRDTEADEDLPLIPPLNGRAGVRYTNPKAGSVELSLRGAARQDKIAEGETETGGYARLDISLSSKEFNLAVARLQVFLGIDNITNTSYTNHLSTNRGAISIEPGRNIFVRLKVGF